MTEEDARTWLIDRFGPQAVKGLNRFVQLLLAESEQQNLISASTIGSLWTRHIVDSAQLLDHAGSDWRHWVDIGSGAGLPGIVIAILSGRRVTMIEPRKLRVSFLNDCIAALSLNAEVLQAKAERVSDIRPADVVSARAVANLGALLASAQGFATRDTIFVLPKGEVAHSEVATARKTWQGSFHVEQSIVDPASGIVVATKVAPR